MSPPWPLPSRCSETLGLRSMFFALASVMTLFAYLHYGLAAVLVFVGAKMLLAGFYKVPTLASLLVIVGLLAVSVVASLLHASRRPRETKAASAAATDTSHAATD